MKTKIFILIYTIILNFIMIIKCNDLYEVHCVNEKQCKQFMHPGIKSLCSADKCQCSKVTGEKIKCKPQYSFLNNIIGGPCPCTQPNSECGENGDVCYCKYDYIPSTDKRRCIKAFVPLNENCERDCQCQMADIYSICDSTSKKCSCLNQFVIDGTKCASAIEINFTCTNDTQCMERYGVNAKCANTKDHCICINGYFASQNNSKCLKSSKYMKNCTESIQCIGSLGLGGKCIDNVCKCSKKFYAEVIKPDDNEDDYEVTKCTPMIEVGTYCRHNGDCYWYHMTNAEETMFCNFGECSCKDGFISNSDGLCVKSSADVIKTFIELNFLLGLVLIVN